MQRAVVEVAPATVTGRLPVPQQARSRRRQLVDSAIEEAGLDCPPHEIPVANAPRRPLTPAASEEHLPARLVQLLRQLAPGLTAADYHDTARRKRAGVAVLLGEDLLYPLRYPLRARRSVSALESAGRHHNGPGPQLSGRHRHEKPAVVDLERPAPSPSGGHAPKNPAVVDLERRDLAVGLDRSVERVRPSLEVVDELRQRHVPIRLLPRVFSARERDAPGGRDEAERVPAPRAPRLSDTAGFEHDVVDARIFEEPACREPGLPSADDRHVHE